MRKDADYIYERILSQSYSRGKKPAFVNEPRLAGKTVRFELGTVYDDGNDYLLMAYSRFDTYNRAYLAQEDILRCYTNMWSEIDKIRGNNSISIPLLSGSGLVRFRKDYSPQQLIELLLWSFSISGIHLSRSATLRIVLEKDSVQDISVLRLLDYSEK